ncbi:tRNA uracil 4-sulfurtransferase ThiI [Rheinheimera baltica]|uniref:tRNA sulfurtransferase n=1 Tax=Rheinheimera baltica TaxID=67576 RepID=A0ABT9HTR1_9GAMM|nr:tRNA uracil 4-sulfurtransferase ThiI [Rheinheimera baltica]MDP5134515.1 tRNA 4-thiouridine(8) synthase ThiI [Rheinheimera baltica]MDP5188789.1 tRNA 4-thiouridine(8) synthase ThiI [Rheinheimera baltica]
MIEFIIKLHPEIAIKSKSVRKRQTLLLERNIKTIVLRVDSNIDVKNSYDHLTIRYPGDELAIKQQLVERLSCIPGIMQFSEMQSSSFTSLHDIYEQVALVYADQLENKSFCVRVRREGKHTFSSIEAERYIGGGLNQLVSTARVQLKKPDVVVALEVRKDVLIMVRRQYQGMGGFPLPSQSDALSLISGGYDSAVASYLMIRKGVRTHYLFFNLGGAAHEAGVREMSHLIWQKYSLSHKVKFVSVNFAPVVEQILENIDSGLMGVVLKRMMMRAAASVAENLGIKALVTGESIGQVASQTIANLNVIDRVTDMLVLRPLIYQDKQEIVDIARKIGAEDIAKSMPEYCGVISNKPTVNAVLADVELNEQKFNFAVLDQAVQEAKVLDIRTVDYQADQQAHVVTELSELPADAIVLDIRSPEETELKPLTVANHAVVELPFFRLASQFSHLDQTKQYYCYCDRGVMSRLQAVILQEQGYANVAVYRP